MQTPSLHFFPDRTSLTRSLADLLHGLFTQTTEHDFAIILSGGQTPLPVYRQLAETPANASPHLHLTLSDERMAPANDPLCNAHHLQPVADAFHIPPNRFLTVNTALPHQKAARDFEAGIDAWRRRNIPFELAVLGLGPDGHTASLFSADDIRRAAGRRAIPVHRPTPPVRVSLTPELFTHTRRIILLAAGAEKAPVIRTLLRDPLSIPCGLALQHAPPPELWTDQPADALR